MGATVREEPQGESLSTLRKSQEIALHAFQALVETIEFFTPAMPAVHVPLARRLPTAHEVVANANDFAEQLLASQRQFADEVTEAASPLRARQGGRARRVRYAQLRLVRG
ncbi:MAG TPA: hypothetical protein VF838_13030 [Trebonia sp.]